MVPAAATCKLAAQQSAAPPLGQPQRPRWRRAQQAAQLQRCRAEAGSGGPSRDEVLARINRAKEYKQTAQQPVAGVAPPPPSPPPPQEQLPAPELPPIATGDDEAVMQAFGQAAQQLASKEEAQFLQAVSDAAAAAASSSSSSSSPGAGPIAPAEAGSGGSGSAGGSTAGREAVLARINAARQYNKQQPAASTSQPGTNGSSGSGSGSSGAAAGMPPPPAPPASAAATAAPAGTTSDAAAAAAAAEEEAERQRSFRTGAGGAGQAANWLIFAEGSGSAAQQLDQNLSAEQFTLAKEELIKQQEVEIISVDAGYAAQVRREKQQGQGGEGGAVGANGGQQQEGALAGEGQEEGDELHKPKVATWGVFPRPRNISEAYGGGRNLRPGQALESEEAAAERQQRIDAALKNYRRTLGLDIDPAVEKKAQDLYDEGVKLFDQGLISTALPRFAEASEIMALRTRLGGEARLQQAICLDSLGRNQEAYEIYTRIENHPAPGVAKKAKRMLFGWKAAENLKTTNLSYQPTTAAWKRYFDTYRNSMYASYVAAEDDSSKGGGSSAAVTALATAVMLAPMAFLAYQVLLR